LITILIWRRGVGGKGEGGCFVLTPFETILVILKVRVVGPKGQRIEDALKALGRVHLRGPRGVADRFVEPLRRAPRGF
jgi:hypothetical protein